jgi:hypothetical protein
MKSSGAMIRVKIELVAIVSETVLSPSSGIYVTIEAAAHIPCLRRSGLIWTVVVGRVWSVQK